MRFGLLGPLETLNERWNEPIVLLAEGVVAHAHGNLEEVARTVARAAEVARSQGSLGLMRRAEAAAAELGLPLATSSE